MSSYGVSVNCATAVYRHDTLGASALCCLPFHTFIVLEPYISPYPLACYAAVGAQPDHGRSSSLDDLLDWIQCFKNTHQGPLSVVPQSTVIYSAMIPCPFRTTRSGNRPIACTTENANVGADATYSPTPVPEDDRDVALIPDRNVGIIPGRKFAALGMASSTCVFVTLAICAVWSQ